MENEGEGSVLRLASKAHRAGRLEEAIELYRRALVEVEAEQPDVCILLANALTAAPGHTPRQQATRNAEATALAASVYEHCCKAEADTVGAPQKALLLCRYANFLLTRVGAFGERADAEAPDGKDSALDAPVRERSDDIGNAIRALQEATRLDESLVLAWRNLGVAHMLAKDADAAVKAFATAVAGSKSKKGAPLDLRVRYAKALRRAGEMNEAAKQFLEALEMEPSNFMLRFWLQVTLASGRVSPAVASCAAAVLQSTTSCACASVAVDAPASADGAAAETAHLVPQSYIRKLFDGYAKKFDAHLTGALGYKTPQAILQLALQYAHDGEAAGDAVTRWNKCLDLGCGTGLAGVEVRGHVTELQGIDISSGMVAEAEARKLYNYLAVAEVEAWLTERAATEEAGTYDLVLSADVFVYIGDLSGIFRGVARIMRRDACSSSSSSTATAARSLFIFSTEADGPATPAGTAASTAACADAAALTSLGARLTSTGRCSHNRTYIRALASKYGFQELAVVRQPIRKNAGVDVVGDLYILHRV